MIKVEQIKQVEQARELVVTQRVHAIIDALILNEATDYDGVEHSFLVPYNWQGFAIYDEFDPEYALSQLSFDVEPIVRQYLETFITQDGLIDTAIHQEDGRFVVTYNVIKE